MVAPADQEDEDDRERRRKADAYDDLRDTVREMLDALLSPTRPAFPREQIRRVLALIDAPAPEPVESRYNGELCGAVSKDGGRILRCNLGAGHLLHRSDGRRWSEPEPVVAATRGADVESKGGSRRVSRGEGYHDTLDDSVSAIDRACKEPTLLDALVYIAIWDTERAVQQARKREVSNPDTGAQWETCFGYLFEQVMSKYPGVDPCHLTPEKSHAFAVAPTDEGVGCIPDCRRDCAESVGGVACEVRKLHDNLHIAKIGGHLIVWWNKGSDTVVLIDHEPATPEDVLRLRMRESKP